MFHFMCVVEIVEIVTRVKQTAECEVCLLGLKSSRMMMGREGEAQGGGGEREGEVMEGWELCGEVRVPTQMLSPPLRGMVARRPQPPSQYGVRKM